MTTNQTRRWQVDFLLLGAIWGASFMFMRLAALELGALPTAALRVLIASLFLLPLLLLKGLWPVLRQHWRPVLFVGVLNSAIPFALYAFAVMHISTGLSAILNATVPLFGALVAWVWLQDKPGLSRTLGLAIGFGGVVLLASGQASFKPNASGVAPAWAVLACLAATTCYALSASFTKKHLPNMPPPGGRHRQPNRCQLGTGLASPVVSPATTAQRLCFGGFAGAGCVVHWHGLCDLFPTD